MSSNTTLPNFRQVRHFSVLPKEVPTVLFRMPNGNIIDIASQNARPADFTPEIVDFVFPDDSAKDAALGRLLDSWSNIEILLRTHFKTLLGVSFAAAAAIANTASGRSLMELLTNQLTLFPLTDAELKQFDKLQDRYKRLNTKRNRTIHGIWALELYVNHKDGNITHTIKIVREYMHEDRQTRDKLMDLKNQKERGKFLHSISQIERIADDIKTLERDISNFLRGLHLENRAKWGWMLDSKPQ